MTQAAHDMYEREDMAVRLRTLPRLSTYIGVVEGGEGKRGREEEGKRGREEEKKGGREEERNVRGREEEWERVREEKWESERVEGWIFAV